MTQFSTAAPAAFRHDALEGVRTRRLTALCGDFFLVSVIATVLFVLLMIFTMGLSLFFLSPLWPIVAFFYNGLTISGSKMATPGMLARDLQMRMYADGSPPRFLNAAAHALLFYLSWCFPVVFLVTLVDSEKRFLHDILAGVIVTRRL